MTMPSVSEGGEASSSVQRGRKRERDPSKRAKKNFVMGISDQDGI